MTHVADPSLLTKARVHLAWRLDRGQILSDLISRELNLGASIVDIGCGNGDLVSRLADRGYKMIGVERDPSSVSVKSKNLSILEGSAESLPSALAPRSYNGVVFSHVLEHLVNPVAAIRLASSLVRPGGLLFCEVPNNDCLIAKQSGASWGHLDAPRHLNFFGQKSIEYAINAAGLKVREIYFTGYTRYFHNSHIATEQNIFDQFIKSGWIPVNAIRNSALLSWGMLGKTAFADARKKYDAVGVVASVS